MVMFQEKMRMIGWKTAMITRGVKLRGRKSGKKLWETSSGVGADK